MSIEDKELICKICNKHCDNIRKLSSHITATHKIKIKKYYDEYLKKEEEGKCIICGKPTNFKNFTFGYRLYCSNKCCTLHTWINRTEDDKQQICEKIKDTKYRKYGDENYNNREQYKQTCIQKYGCTSTNQVEEIKNKKINTWLNLYGVDNPRKAEEIKNKIKETFYNNYGCYATKSEEIQEKIKSTNNEKYGVNFPLQNPEIFKKAAITLHENGNSSSWEDYLSNELDNIIGNDGYIMNYFDNRYPFACDFYIINKDLFIEINGYWTHGEHWFNKDNEEDLNILRKWEEKAQYSEIYKNAIEIWTKKDLEKKSIAELNKLNYIVLWTMDEIKQFVEELK